MKSIKTPNHPAYHWSTLWPLEVWVRGLYNAWWFCVHKLSMFIYLSMGMAKMKIWKSIICIYPKIKCAHSRYWNQGIRKMVNMFVSYLLKKINNENPLTLNEELFFFWSFTWIFLSPWMIYHCFLLQDQKIARLQRRQVH